jgi:hypothetical protein
MDIVIDEATADTRFPLWHTYLTFKHPPGRFQLNAFTYLVTWRSANGLRAYARTDNHPISDLIVRKRQQQQIQGLDSSHDSLLHSRSDISGLSVSVKKNHISSTHKKLVHRSNSTRNQLLHSINIHLSLNIGQCQNIRHHRPQVTSANSATLQHAATDFTICLRPSECLSYGIPTRPPTLCSRMLTLTQAEKHETILALQQHRINTLPSLRRVELAFAALNTPDVAEPMTAAWTYYVSSHGLLTELRALTRSCPFSSHCVEEAKRRVYADPESNCSWNLAWLVLRKIKDDQLVAYYAQYQAAQPASWGGRTPKEEQAKDFSDKLQREWKGALRQMLRYWEEPPTQ